MLTLSVERLVEIVGGELLAGPDSTMVNGLVLDSRDVTPGCAFVAFAGERVDGHDYLPQAIEAGARALLVTRDEESFRETVATARRPDVTLVRIEDPLAAMQALAAYHRTRLTCPVVAITGSTGKTTTKDLVRSVLGVHMRVTATNGNQNNELGVPLTIMEAGADTEVLVLEMAMRGTGQIEHLCKIAQPTVGLVTNVGYSHVELLGSQEAIASAKGELVRAIPSNGTVFLNGDDGWSDSLAAIASAPVVTYGLDGSCMVRAQSVTVEEDGTASFVLIAPAGSAPVHLNVPGRHNVYNALAAAAIGLDFDLSFMDVVKGLEGAVFTGMRMETFVSASGVTVVNDAYNANPSSMKAALRTLSEMPATGKRVAVLGDMAELGSLSELAHFKVGGIAAQLGIDVLVTVGERARRIADGALAGGMAPDLVRPCPAPDQAVEVLDDVLAEGDVVLIKASRVMGLEQVVEGITQPHA